MRKVGIEHEFFVFEKDGSVPSFQRNEELFAKLNSKGFLPYDPVKKLTISKEVGDGYMAISNDFCTHILEVAFPPVRTISELQSMERYFNQILDSVSEIGLVVKTETFQNVADDEVCFMPHPKFDWFSTRIVPEHKYSERYPTSKITSTQIDVDIMNPQQFFKNMGNAYSFEYLISFLFSRRGEKDIRSLVWRDSFLPEYILNGYVRRDVKSYEDYLRQVKAVPGLVRDYSFVAPRNKQRVEFRGAGSQSSFKGIVALANARITLMEVLENPMFLGTEVVSPADYYLACETGIHDKDLIGRLLSSVLDHLGQNLQLADLLDVDSIWRSSFG